MNILSEADFIQQLRRPAPGYLLFGDEDYTKLYAVSRLRNTFCTDVGTVLFNCIRMSALDYTPVRLLDALELPPMLSSRKLIIVSGLDPGIMRADEINALCEVLSHIPEYEYNTLALVIPEGALDEGRLPSRPSPLLTRLSERLLPVRFPRNTPAKLAAWAVRHFSHNCVTAPLELCAKLVDYCGTSMYKLAGEIDKVSWFVRSSGRREVTERDITDAAVPDTAYDAFAFANALTVRDSRRALDILSVMMARRTDPVMIMGDISRVFCDMLSVRMLADEGLGAPAIAGIMKMHEYRAGLYLAGVAGTDTESLRRLLTLCAETDAAVKLSPRGYSAIERFICSI